jgi:hypothetical protein
VISVLPFSTPIEVKPGVFPGRYQVPGAEKNSVAILIVERGMKKAERFDGMPPMEMVELSDVIASAIVRDYSEAQLGTDGTGGPGLGYVPNVILTKEEIVEGRQQVMVPESDSPIALKEIVQRLRVRQLNWFKNLVKFADDEWTRYHRHRNISDLMRLAAVETGQITREWLSLDLIEEMVECQLCLTKIPARAIMCRDCGAVQPGKEEQARKFLFVKAGPTAPPPPPPVK